MFQLITRNVGVDRAPFVLRTGRIVLTPCGYLARPGHPRPQCGARGRL